MADNVITCGSQATPIDVRQRGQHLVVDIHCHIQIAAAEGLVRAEVTDFPNPFSFMSQHSREVNVAQFAQIGPKLNGIDQRLADMDRLGIDVQAISPSPGQYYYFAPPELGRTAARMVNDGIAAAMSAHPDRLVGMGTVPLQDVGMAIAEMQRCVSELGLRGIEIGTNVNGVELADPRFRPFLAEAERLGVLLFMHPLGFTHGQRLSGHYLDNLIGNPLESTIALSHLIFEGVLEQFHGLKLCIAHGGGFLPGYWGRLDHGYHAREDCRAHICHPPSHYLRKVWLDTLVFDKDELDWLVKTHGADRLCMGSDYPFDMSEPDPVSFHDRLTEGEKAAILGGNAAALLGLRSIKA